MFFLHHGAQTTVTPLKPHDVLERLLPVATIPWGDRVVLPQVLDVCDRLIADVPAFDLHFRPVAAAVDIIERFVAQHT